MYWVHNYPGNKNENKTAYMKWYMKQEKPINLRENRHKNGKMCNFKDNLYQDVLST